MHRFMSLDPDLLYEEQRERLAAAAMNRRKQEMLVLAGYRPPSDRLRARAAGWLIWLATRLDARAVEPATPVSSLRHA